MDFHLCAFSFGQFMDCYLGELVFAILLAFTWCTFKIVWSKNGLLKILHLLLLIHGPFTWCTCFWPTYGLSLYALV
jgi:hypothetical protein